jgi:epoxyqueuosine reductase
MTPAELGDAISIWAKDLGFQKVGITDIDLSEHEPHVRAWLDKGFHGSMGYLQRNLEKRLHPEQLEEQTCRVIVARMDYFPDAEQPLRVLRDPTRGYVSRYALGRDYHKVVRRRLVKLARRIDAAASEQDARYRAFTDSAPVLEKALGEKAGLGWIGKHSLLLDRDAGSWFFLGEIYTNLPLPLSRAPQQDHCGQCRACMNNCPTGAIVGPKQIDARKCISYLTIESKGPIPAHLRKPMGNRVFGCDDCQLYCPWNREAPQTAEPDFSPRHELDLSSLVTLFEWSQETFNKKTEGSAIRRISHEQWQRNLAVALGNGPATSKALTALEGARKSATPMVAEHIDWALKELRARPIQDE